MQIFFASGIGLNIFINPVDMCFSALSLIDISMWNSRTGRLLEILLELLSL